MQKRLAYLPVICFALPAEKPILLSVQEQTGNGIKARRAQRYSNKCNAVRKAAGSVHLCGRPVSCVLKRSKSR